MAALTRSHGLPRWSDYTAFLRRHLVWLVGLTGLGLLAGVAWAMTQPTTYSATASVTLAKIPVYVMRTTNELVPPEVSIDTDAQLLQSPRVLGAVADALGQDPDDAGDHLSVTATPNTHVLHVTVSSTSARRAADAANAAVTALVDVRRRKLGALRSEEVRQLRLLVSNQERQLAKEQAGRLVLPATDELFASLLELRTRLDELKESRRQPGLVLASAQPPTDQARRDTEVPVTSGAMLGLLAACLVGAARDRARPVAHTPANAQDLSTTGQVPATALRIKEYHHVA